MDIERFGQGIRAVRCKLGWTQAQLGDRAGVSQVAVSRAERGAAQAVSLPALDRIARALGARASLRLYWHGENLDRLLDAAHAGLVEQVVQLLRANGWEVVPELTFSVYGERGSIDVLAWHPGHRALLVVEVKSTVADMQAMLAGIDRKLRLAPGLATERGWVVRHTSRLLVLPGDSTARRRIDAHAATVSQVLPLRTVAVRRWMRKPEGPMGGVLFLAGSQHSTMRRR
jgi:transcriptional regulator with XRE-family HTH domain